MSAMIAVVVVQLKLECGDDEAGGSATEALLFTRGSTGLMCCTGWTESSRVPLSEK